MNGRVYDPVLGKFLSADPNVQFEKSVTSYNRYSYVSNNPLKYTDPSGYFLKKLLQNISPQLATVISLALNFIPAVGPALSMMFNMMYAAANGASAGQIAFSMALSAAGSSVGGKVAGAYDLAANSFKYTVVQGAVAGAFTGGVNAAVGGGNIRRGILQGAASGAAMSGIQWKMRQSLTNRLMPPKQPEGVMVDQYRALDADYVGAGKDLEDYKLLRNFAKALKDDPTTVDVVAHANANVIKTKFGLKDAEWFAENEIKPLLTDKVKLVRLFACNTGSTDNGFAQQLANALKIDVQAPTEYFYPQFETKDLGTLTTVVPDSAWWVIGHQTTDGSFINSGRMKTFSFEK